MPQSSMRPQVRPEDWSRTTLALRHLARELVDSREQGEDLVQGTLVAALEHPPRANTWSWLASVLRNRARDLGRTRSRRGPMEELPPLESPTPDAIEIAQRLELQEDLTQALRALDEPYRSTLYLRFFEGLAPSEIARSRAVPVKTVKTRLERGLARLRQQLESRHGPGLRAFLPLLRPLNLGLGTAIVSVPAGGVLLLMWKKLALVAALLLAGFIAWRVQRSDGSEAAHATAAPSPAFTQPAPAQQDSSGLVAPDAKEARERSAALDANPPKAEAPIFGTLNVLLRWHDGTPAADVAVNFRRELALSNGAERGLLRATSDSEGRVHSGELLPGPIRLMTNRGDDKTVDVAAGEEREVVIDIAAGVEVEGRVLDARDVQVAGAEIWLTSDYVDWLGMARVAITDSNGDFHLRDIPSRQSLGATAANFAPSGLMDLELQKPTDDRVKIVLRLADLGGALQGQVSDAHGVAIEGANVCVGTGHYSSFRMDGTFEAHWAPRLSKTGVDGRFRFEGLPPGSVAVSVRSKSAPLWTGASEVRAGANAELAVTLQEGASLTGVVRDAQGALVEHAVVHAFRDALSPNFITMGQYDDPSVFGSPLSMSDAQGRYQVDGIWSGEVHVYASPPRREEPFATEFHAEAVLHPAPGERVEWNPILEPGRTIRGHTRFADGEPMPNVFVSTIEEGQDERRTLHVGEDGHFEFFNLPPGPFRVEVQLSSPPPSSHPLFKNGVYPNGIEFDLTADFQGPEKHPSAKVRGRFSDPLARFAKPLTPTLQSAGGVGYFAKRSDESGFEFTNVAAGHYRVFGYMGQERSYFGADFEVRAGDELDLGTLEIPRGATLTVRLRRSKGLEGEQVGAYFHPRDRMEDTKIDFSNSDEVVFQNLTIGAYVLTLYGGVESAQLMRNFELTGDMILELPLRPGQARKIELEFTPKTASGELHVMIQEAGGETIEDQTYSSAWNEHAPFKLEYRLPTGHFTVHARTSTGFEAGGEIDVANSSSAAEPLRLELR